MKAGEVCGQGAATAWTLTWPPFAFQVTPKKLQKHVNEVLFPTLEFKKCLISLRQSQQWLKMLGFHRKRHTKGVYWDGHERKDVQVHRQWFLDQLDTIQESVFIVTKAIKIDIQIIQARNTVW